MEAAGEHYARTLALVLRHRVQIFSWRLLPSIMRVARWTLDLIIWLVCTLEWLTFLPKPVPLPQISHFAKDFSCLFVLSFCQE